MTDRQATASPSPHRAAAPTLAAPNALEDAFDPPIVEPVDFGRDPNDPARRDVRDVVFARADMEYWSALCAKMKLERVASDNRRLAAKRGLDMVTRFQIERDIENQKVMFSEVLRLQYDPAGITKLLDDALWRGGMKNAVERQATLRRIGPGRQSDLAADVCSEPKPTVQQFRDAVKQRALKMGILPGDVDRMSDQELILLASEYTPPNTGADESEGGGVPLSAGPSSSTESTGSTAPPSSQPSTDAMPAS